MEEVEKKYKDYNQFYELEIKEKLPVRLAKFRQKETEEKIEAFYNDVVSLYKSRFYSERREQSTGLSSAQTHGLYLKRVLGERELFADEEVNLYLQMLNERIDKVLAEKMGANAIDNNLLFSTLINYLPAVNTLDGKALLLELKEKFKETGKEIFNK